MFFKRQKEKIQDIDREILMFQETGKYDENIGSLY